MKCTPRTLLLLTYDNVFAQMAAGWSTKHVFQKEVFEWWAWLYGRGGGARCGGGADADGRRGSAVIWTVTDVR